MPKEVFWLTKTTVKVNGLDRIFLLVIYRLSDKQCVWNNAKITTARILSNLTVFIAKKKKYNEI